jgi:hypothetical protein
MRSILQLAWENPLEVKEVKEINEVKERSRPAAILPSG